MKLNDLSPEYGAKKKSNRVGRGIGSGLGKKEGRGHKGLKSCSGGTVKAGFEGGQMPIQRRVPKFGFTSRVSLATQELSLSALAGVETGDITLDVLKKAGLIRKNTKFVKIMLSGTCDKAFKLNDASIRVSKGARAAIEAAGGSVVIVE
ncbi:MAG: 50S ribosomal protein L15 [Gammaproteobacteria bacterium]